MEIKNIDNFTIEDCETYLSANQNNVKGNFYNEVLDRYNQLIAARENKQNENISKLQKEIAELRSKTKWIDIDQFLENRKYFSLTGLRFFLYLIFIISFLLLIEIGYYTVLNHYIYSYEVDEQLMQTSGLENIFLNLQFIGIKSWESYPSLQSYRLGDAGFGVIVFFIGSLFLLLFTSLINSSIIKKIYNIQDGDKKNRFRAIENEKGKKGLCKAGHFKIKKIIPIEYDDIFATYENSYVCCKDGKYGVFNTDLKKMTIPVIYDSIYSIDPNSIVLIQNKVKYSFTNKGYRLVK